MADQTFTRSEVEALGAKLNALDLTDDERALLEAVLRASADESEVEGFASVHIDQINTSVQVGGGLSAGIFGSLFAGWQRAADEQARKRAQARADRGLT